MKRRFFILLLLMIPLAASAQPPAPQRQCVVCRVGTAHKTDSSAGGTLITTSKIPR